jgi:hypothetical protein
VTGIIAVIDPGVAAETAAAAVHAAAPGTGQRRRLAWALQDDPELLTGAGARAPVPSVLRLIDGLADAGAQRIVRPACPHCGRVIALVKPRDGVRLCRNCVARSRAEQCSRCGVVREPATRDEHGRPLCPCCLTSDPANLETCIGCARRRVVSVRTTGGPLCPGCRPVKTMACSICARLAPAEISKITGEPWCHACQKRRARCAVCGDVRQVRGGTTASPLCGTCIRPASYWHACPGCGEHTQHRSRRCARCSLLRRLDELLRDDTGTIHPRLQALPIVLPEPLDALVLQLLASRRGHAALGDQGTSRWLFPGGQPGQPISACRLAGRLRQLGLRPGPARSTALFGLATELPAALLARLLGIHISVAVAWQRASSGDWTAYAADYSRRRPGSKDLDDDAEPGPR